jgi:hypothetical protein
MLITKTKLIDGPASSLVPGSVIRTDSTGVLVQCGDRLLLVVAAEPVTPEADDRLTIEG